MLCYIDIILYYIILYYIILYYITHSPGDEPSEWEARQLLRPLRHPLPGDGLSTLM